MRTLSQPLVRLLAVALIGSGPVFQTATAQEVAEGEDPPDRVVRLSYRQGDVQLAEAESSEWATALLNRPLTTGDRLWADQDARAELQVGSATVHIDEYTGLEVVSLGNEDLRLSLTEGVLNIHVRDVGRGQAFEIDTPNSAVSLREPGEYHIEVNEGGDTTVVKVQGGAATVASGERGDRTYHVDQGRQGIFSGRDSVSAAIDRIGPRSDFDEWSNGREQRASRSGSTRYVSREMIGYEDLDDNGDWHTHRDYGSVWYPRRVVSGWAPYRYGHWAWVRPWGWTWIDDAPWGFAPFHYGRWAYIDSRWGWVPGPRSYRPVYAPALVAWVGGPSISVSLSLGSGIGWFPLGPREVYIPGYRTSRRYVDNVNITNTYIVNNTYITNVYRNRGRDQRYIHQGRGDAITVVSGDDFRRGRPVDRNRVRWDGNGGAVVEPDAPNTFRPERGNRGDRFVRTEPAERVQGRVDNPRSATARREAAEAEERERRSFGGPRPPSAGSRSRDDSNVRQEGQGSAPDTDRREIGRPRDNRPATSSDKRDRTITRLEQDSGRATSVDPAPDRERSSRLQTAPDPTPRGGSEVRPSERPREQRQILPGNPYRSERRDTQPERREVERSRENTAPRVQRQQQVRPEAQSSQGQQESRSPGNPAVDRGRREIAPQGQKGGEARQPGRRGDQ